MAIVPSDQIIRGPRRTSINGTLFNSGVVVDPPDDRWLGGLAWQRDPILDVSADGIGCGDVSDAPDSAECDPRQTTPIMLRAAFGGSTFARGVQRYSERLRDEADRALGYYAAQELWTGATSVDQSLDNFYLSDPDTVSPLTDVDDDTDALGLAAAYGAVIQAIAEQQLDAAGVVYMPVAALFTLEGTYGIQRVGTAFFDVFGNRIIADGGFTGQGPTDSTNTSGQFWIYGTGAIEVYRGAVNINTDAEALDRSTNTLKYIATSEFAYSIDLLGADGVAVAARVNKP